MFLQERANVEPRCVASEGYDLPPLVSMSDFDLWSKFTPPTGTITVTVRQRKPCNAERYRAGRWQTVNWLR